MKLAYALKEGLIDIRRFPTEWDPEKGKKTRIQVLLNGTAGVKIVDTNLGSKALLSVYTGEMLLLDSQAIEDYGVDVEIILNLNTHDAIQALKD